MSNEFKDLSDEELRKLAEDTCLTYNAQYQGEQYKEAIETGENIKQMVNEYTARMKSKCFIEIRSSENPMLAAVTKFKYDTIRQVEKKSEEDKAPIWSIIDTTKDIDLLEVDKFVGGMGVDRNWKFTIQKFNCQLTMRALVKRGMSVSDVKKLVPNNYYMADIAKEKDTGVKDPTSNTQLLKALNLIIAEMIGKDYKANSYIVNDLTEGYIKVNKNTLARRCMDHRRFTQKISEVCNKIVTKKGFDVEYRNADKKFQQVTIGYKGESGNNNAKETHEALVKKEKIK